MQEQKDPNELVKVATPKVKGNDSGFKIVHRRDMLPGESVIGEEEKPTIKRNVDDEIPKVLTRTNKHN